MSVPGRRTHRALDRIADRLPYHRGASARFDDLVVRRRSWGYWFVARVAIQTSRAHRFPAVRFGRPSYRIVSINN